MKKLLFRKFLLLILYTLVYLYFMVFNWKMFIISLNVDLGFTVVNIPPFIILFLLGFIIIGILSWIGYVSNLKKIIYELEHGVEIGKIKDKMVRNKVQEHLMDEKTIGILKNKIGIGEISARQEEMVRMINDLKTKLGKEGLVNQSDQSQKDN